MASDEFDDLTAMESADHIMANQTTLATSKDLQSKPASQPQAPPKKITYADVVATMREQGAYPRSKPAENIQPTVNSEVAIQSLGAPSAPPHLQTTQRGITSIKGKERAPPSTSSVLTYETTDDEEEM
jgi:hypothetical protein